MKVALIIEVDESKDKAYYNIGEITVTDDGEIKKKKNIQTPDIWILGMLGAIIRLTHAGHAAGIIDSAKVFKNCKSILEAGFISPNYYNIKFNADNHINYVDQNEKMLFIDPISFSENEYAFLINAIHQKPHYNEVEAIIVRDLFSYFDLEESNLPEQVQHILKKKNFDDNYLNSIKK